MKKPLIITFVIMPLVIIFCILYAGNYFGKRPFKNLDADSIKNATVSAIPPEKSAAIHDRETLIKLAEILNRVTIYQQDDSGREYDGQLVEFTIVMKDDSTLEIEAYGSFLVINSTWYKTKYKPSQELNALGNKIIDSN